MLRIRVQVTPECEELLTRLPRGYGMELLSEEYTNDASGTLEIGFHDVESDDLPTGIAQSLDIDDGVISYTVM